MEFDNEELILVLVIFMFEVVFLNHQFLSYSIKGYVKMIKDVTEVREGYKNKDLVNNKPKAIN